MKSIGLKSILLLATIGLIAPFARADEPSLGTAPVIFEWDGKDVAAAKAKAAAGDVEMAKAIQQLVGRADESLKMEPPSVMQKESVPPSGDKHDYTSLSPYWWPDPSKPDGKPYIRKDGVYNPERMKYDAEKMDSMSEAALNLAFAYYFTGDEKYAVKAKQIISVWFFDDATRMNPSLKFSQFVPGEKEIRGTGTLDTHRLRRVVDADGLLAGSKSWTADDSQHLKSWFKDFLDSLLHGNQGTKEAKSPNNHGTWYGTQIATYALYLGNKDLARDLLKQYVQARIASQVDPDGSQPMELVRTKAFDYVRFNILAHEDAALLGQQVDLDLWNYKTEDGRSLRAAIDWLAPYATGEKKWDRQQITPTKYLEAASVYRRAANAYHEPKYEEIARQTLNRLDDKDKADNRLNLLFPSHVSAAH